MAARMAPPKEDPTRCRKCDEVFATWKAYHLHKMNSEKHTCCPVCSADFANLDGYKRHQKFAHAQEQDLHCPGCGVVFTRVGGLMGHLEQNQCPGMHAYEARKAHIQQTTGQFERIKQLGANWGSDNDDVTFPPIDVHASYSLDANIPASFDNHDQAQEENKKEVDLINFDAPTAALNSAWGPAFTAPAPTPKFNVAHDFPRLGAQSNQSSSRLPNIMDEPLDFKKPTAPVALPPHLMHAKKENVPPRGLAPLRTAAIPSVPGRAASNNPPSTTSSVPTWDRQTIVPSTPTSATGIPAWTTQKNLFPDAPPAVAPPADLLGKMSISADTPDAGTKFSKYDPNDPDFRIGKFYVSITGKYKCPHMGCPKSLPTPGAFKQHLQSPAHMTENQKLQCVKCLRYYRDATALTQHSEAQGVRCLIREDERFGVYIDEITASTAATAGRHKDDTIKYVVNDQNPFSAANRVLEANTAAQAANEKTKKTYWNDNKPKW